MTAPTSHSRNDELFTRFYALQGDLASRLSAHPQLIRDWLAAQPAREGEGRERASPPKTWRAARLTIRRRRELVDLVARAEQTPAETAPLAAWLLGSVPVRTYLDIAEAARPDLRTIDAAADECCREVVRMRETLLMANYGLAKIAAHQRNSRDATELLSAALCGLLDAIDRYVPDAKAARFAYFASYWIRYHLSRQIQKYGSVVSFPVNQHRIGHRIDRYLAGREASGLAPPSNREIRSELDLGPDAYYWHQLRPRMVSFQSPAGYGEDAPTLEHFIRDPAPDPAAAMEESETAGLIGSLVRAHAAPATRVMLAYVRSVGSLADAAEDYLNHLHEQALERIRPLAAQSFSGRRNCL